MGRLVPLGLPYGGWIGAALVLAGLVLMARRWRRCWGCAPPSFRAATRSALVTGGVFALSRNPIYLADALVLAGLLIVWQALWAAAAGARLHGFHRAALHPWAKRRALRRGLAAIGTPIRRAPGAGSESSSPAGRATPAAGGYLQQRRSWLGGGRLSQPHAAAALVITQVAVL